MDFLGTHLGESSDLRRQIDPKLFEALGLSSGFSGQARGWVKRLIQRVKKGLCTGLFI